MQAIVHNIVDVTEDTAAYRQSEHIELFQLQKGRQSRLAKFIAYKRGRFLYEYDKRTLKITHTPQKKTLVNISITHWREHTKI